ncbi:hypothetical protein AB9F26_19635 [Falsihalocynthiibacter sp. BN13B15]|uniref:hypothetical protein n=1 Tax=Falsihalocynthiibacter sp. BN13B15 TaxID=3240871 RepID=UPI00351077A0
MNKILSLTAIAALSLGMAAPVFAQDLVTPANDDCEENVNGNGDECGAVPPFNEVNAAPGLSDNAIVGIAVLGAAAAIGLLANSGGTNGT